MKTSHPLKNSLTAGRKMSNSDAGIKKLFGDRTRTNFLRKYEQAAISGLLKYVPQKFTPNTLTGIGFFGSVLVLIAFVLSTFYHPGFLWLAIAGLAINWLGDSLDGRLAYYRGIPRKWYGFTLDIIMDWLSTIMIGAGSLFYTDHWGQAFAFAIIVMYGWSMIIALLRYKIADIYRIDSGPVGPTEFRIVLSVIIMLEFFLPGTLRVFLGILALALLAINLSDTRELLSTADYKDKKTGIQK